jgi:hypothetical protein
MGARRGEEKVGRVFGTDEPGVGNRVSGCVGPRKRVFRTELQGVWDRETTARTRQGRTV